MHRLKFQRLPSDGDELQQIHNDSGLMLTDQELQSLQKHYSITCSRKGGRPKKGLKGGMTPPSPDVKDLFCTYTTDPTFPQRSDPENPFENKLIVAAILRHYLALSKLPLERVKGLLTMSYVNQDFRNASKDHSQSSVGHTLEDAIVHTTCFILQVLQLLHQTKNDESSVEFSVEYETNLFSERLSLVFFCYDTHNKNTKDTVRIELQKQVVHQGNLNEFQFSFYRTYEKSPIEDQDIAGELLIWINDLFETGSLSLSSMWDDSVIQVTYKDVLKILTDGLMINDNAKNGIVGAVVNLRNLHPFSEYVNMNKHQHDQGSINSTEDDNDNPSTFLQRTMATPKLYTPQIYLTIKDIKAIQQLDVVKPGKGMTVTQYAVRLLRYLQSHKLAEQQPSKEGFQLAQAKLDALKYYHLLNTSEQKKVIDGLMERKRILDEQRNSIAEKRQKPAQQVAGRASLWKKKKTPERVLFKGKMYVVFIGPKGGRYIRRGSRFVPVQQQIKV